jgi:hypothetical protein
MADIKLRNTKEGCDYQGYEFGGGYLDSVCIDGYLWDADSGEAGEDGLWYYDWGGDIPCPICNHDEWVQYFDSELFDRGYCEFEKGTPFEKLEIKSRYSQDDKIFLGWMQDGWNEARQDSQTGAEDGKNT